MADHNRRISTLAMCVLLAVLVVWGEVCLCQIPARPSTEEVHISVQLRRLSGDPVDHSGPSDQHS